MAEPDELYTLRAQYWLGHYAMAIDEARSVARRPMSPSLKIEREELLHRSQLALGHFDKVATALSNADTPGLQALQLKAQFDALLVAASASSGPDESAQTILCDRAKSLVGGGVGASSPMAQLVVAQLLLSAGQLKEALQLVHAGTTPEHSLLALQLYLKLDRLDLATAQLKQLLQHVDDDFVLAQLGSVYLGLTTGSSGAADALHSLTALSEQYGPSPYMLNLMACALLQQGDAIGAEQKLLECYRDHLNEGTSGASNTHHPLVPDTLINLMACCIQQGKLSEAATHLQILQQQCPSHPFNVGVLRVQSAFAREATKYKV